MVSMIGSSETHLSSNHDRNELKSVIVFFAAFPISSRNKDRLVRNQDNVLERRCMPTIKLRTVFVSISEHDSPSGE